MKRADIVVIGGGLTGVAAAYVAAKSGVHVVHLAPKSPPDKRTSALMFPSVEFMREAGLIDEPGALGVALAEIRIIDATNRLIRAPETVFRAEEAGREAFGWNFGNAQLLETFAARAATLSNLEILDQPASGMEIGAEEVRVTLADGQVIEARLVVGADGKRSSVRRWAGISAREHNYAQSALVCDLELERAIGSTSIEFHYENGPFTLVPAGGQKANLVWVDDAATLKSAQALSEDALNDLFAARSQHLFGKTKNLFRPVVFPLSTLSVAEVSRGRVLLIGEAAHAFPPIGAQGLNLGLRDVAALSDAMAEVSVNTDDRGMRLCAVYARLRTRDVVQTGLMVDGLFRSLISDFLPVQAVRSTGLWALKLLPGLRKRAMAGGMGER